MQSEPSQQIRNVGFASLTYCVTCFICGAAIYLTAILTGDVEFRDATGAVVADFKVPASTFYLSSLFTGAITTICCLGGLIGVRLLPARRDGRLIRHALNAAVLGLIGSGVFLTIGRPLGGEHYALRALLVAGICTVTACLTKSYLTARMDISQPGGGTS